MNLRVLVLCAFFLTACVPSGPSEAEVQASAQALAASWLQTEAAIPSATPLPSNTPEPSPTSPPSNTPEPAPTESATPAPAQSDGAYITVTPFGYMEPNQMASAQANKDDQNAPLVLVNRTEDEIRLQLLTPIYQEYTFTHTMTLIVPEGSYTYRAWIGGKGPRNGSFSITNGDKHELIFRENQINFSVP